MLINDLFHIAIKSPNLEATRKFYVDILGMEIAERPEMGFPGYWFKQKTPNGHAIIHVYGGWAAKEADGTTTTGTGAIDHLAITAVGFDEIREQVKTHGLDWRENIIPAIGLWQIFVHDPSGVMLELSFSEAAETIERPEVDEARQYKPGENFFATESYLALYG